MKIFEYTYETVMNGKWDTDKNIAMMNDKGKAGWEVITAFPANPNNSNFTIIFKREFQEQNR